MRLSSNLLYLLLLYAVLDKDNRLSVTTGLLIAGGIMLFGACCCNQEMPRICCNRRRSDYANPFIIANNL